MRRTCGVHTSDDDDNVGDGGGDDGDADDADDGRVKLITCGTGVGKCKNMLTLCCIAKTLRIMHALTAT